MAINHLNIKNMSCNVKMQHLLQGNAAPGKRGLQSREKNAVFPSDAVPCNQAAETTMTCVICTNFLKILRHRKPSPLIAHKGDHFCQLSDRSTKAAACGCDSPHVRRAQIWGLAPKSATPFSGIF